MLKLLKLISLVCILITNKCECDRFPNDFNQVVAQTKHYLSILSQNPYNSKLTESVLFYRELFRQLPYSFKDKRLLNQVGESGNNISEGCSAQLGNLVLSLVKKELWAIKSMSNNNNNKKKQSFLVKQFKF